MFHRKIPGRDICESDTYNLTTGGGGGFYYINKHKLNNSSDQYRISADKIKADTEYAKWFGKQVSNGLQRAIETGSFDPRPFLGKTHTEESKRRIGEANSKHQSGKGNSQYGSMWITNERENRKIKKADQIPKGWRKGRVIKK